MTSEYGTGFDPVEDDVMARAFEIFDELRNSPGTEPHSRLAMFAGAVAQIEYARAMDASLRRHPAAQGGPLPTIDVVQRAMDDEPLWSDVTQKPGRIELNECRIVKGQKVTFTVVCDAYEKQSSAQAHVWDQATLNWTPVTRYPASEWWLNPQNERALAGVMGAALVLRQRCEALLP